MAKIDSFNYLKRLAKPKKPKSITDPDIPKVDAPQALSFPSPDANPSELKKYLKRKMLPKFKG